MLNFINLDNYSYETPVFKNLLLRLQTLGQFESQEALISNLKCCYLYWLVLDKEKLFENCESKDGGLNEKQQQELKEIIEFKGMDAYIQSIDCLKHSLKPEENLPEPLSLTLSISYTNDKNQNGVQPAKLSLQELAQKINSGEEIPNIKKVPNVLNSNPPTVSKLKPKPKPWEQKS